MIKYFLLLFFTCISIIGNSQKKASLKNDLDINKDLSDSALLDLVQKQTFKYFWEGAEPTSGLARERFHADDIYPENDKSYEEIEDLTGFNYNQVKSYIQNGKRNMKIYLSRILKDNQHE